MAKSYPAAGYCGLANRHPWVLSLEAAAGRPLLLSLLSCLLPLLLEVFMRVHGINLMPALTTPATGLQCYLALDCI